MMQRRVGQHHTKLIILGGDASKLQLLRGKQNRPSNRRQQYFSIGRKPNQVTCYFKTPRHQRKRLFLPELSCTQGGVGRWISGIAGEVKASKSLDGDNLAFSEKQGCPADRFDVVGDHCRAFMQRKRRTAAGASNWLRMEAAIGGVVILTAAIAIHRPRTHGGIRPVVGQSEDDSVTRPAIDAADVGIAVS